MSTDQRIGAVSAPQENSQRFQRILKFLSAKNSVKIFKLYTCTVGKDDIFALKNRFFTVHVYSETTQRHQRADLALKISEIC